MAKSKGTDPKKETEARIKRTEAYAEKVRLLFAQTVNDILALNKTMPELDDGVMFSFDGESMKKQKEVEALLRRLHSAVTLAIREGVDVEWSKANAEADRLIKSVFGRKVLDSPEFTAWTQRNTAARDAFLARSEKGLNLSDRVWKSVNQLRDEMEVAITVSIGEGKSASAMSREVRQYLNDPDLMFRRFRYKKGEDDGGNPIYGRKWKKRVKDEATGKYRWIDYDRDSYPTGQGVYKSSAKNAMRLTRTETNMAYRRADHERWMQMDFVIGQRIQTAHDHKEKDICDKLKGDYPKDFVFTGWHPQCFCFATPILIDDRYTDSMEDMFLRGEDWEGEIRKRAEEHSIRELPDSFKRWVSENGEKIAASRKRGTEPYFLRENRAAVDGILGKKQSVKVEDTIVGRDAAGNTITHEEWYGTPPNGKGRKSERIEDLRKEYESYATNPNYKDCAFDEKTGGFKATHIGHAYHSSENETKYFGLTASQLENACQQKISDIGHSAILLDESRKDANGDYLPALDLMLDGKIMDIRSFTEMNENTVRNALNAKNRQLKNVFEKTAVESDSLCLYYHDKSVFSKDALEEGIEYYRSNKKQTGMIKHIYIVKKWENYIEILDI